MSDFSLYLQLGLEHITDLNAYVHMLFIIALCVLFKFTEWKKVLILVTAFTIGHSATLALSVLSLIQVNSDLIETLIPITIALTCMYNILVSIKKSKVTQLTFHYTMALFFGLIHGMGFANYLKALLGGEESVVWPLFSFNLGIELGQIGIVLGYFLLYFLVSKLIKIEHRWVVITVSAIAGLIALKMIFL